MLTHVLGFPRIGAQRELKKTLESFWSKKIGQKTFEKRVHEIKLDNWKQVKSTGIDYITVGDFSLYDQMLDLTQLFGTIPERFQNNYEDPLQLYFAMGRGDAEKGIAAMEMTKWFDTNYHYIVPEFGPKTRFTRCKAQIVDDVIEAKNLGYNPKPVLIGPITYLSLGKEVDGFNRWELLPQLIEVYKEVIAELSEHCELIQIDEPILVKDVTDEVKTRALESCKALKASCDNAKLLVATYFETLGENLDTFLNIDADVLHFDFVYGKDQIEEVIEKFPADKSISLGVINGRNIWKANLTETLETISKVSKKIDSSRILLSSSCSLLHSPVDLRSETKLPADILNWLSFAVQKCQELTTLQKAVSGEDVSAALAKNSKAIADRKNSKLVHNQDVKSRCEEVTAEMFNRTETFSVRKGLQKSYFNLPELPTTTIGSFPQTPQIRKIRRDYKKGEIDQNSYQAEIETIIAQNVKIQNDLGLDVLVHGEPERNDMVEYFGEMLNGFCFTQFGWVQSYGSRCVKPPIIFGDIYRPQPMTVEWTKYAASLSHKPMKGMLTGPVTILCWSFVRDDLPRSGVCKQLALAIRDEVKDLEDADIKMIQIDEAAFREGMPLKESKKDEYLQWAVDCFKLASSPVENTTQIHTHMCYSDFNSIAEWIAKMDADVISIEASRSGMKLLESFKEFAYPNEIGPGIYDIHSPRVPSVAEMVDLLQKGLEVIPRSELWVNPDCGLKTRKWEETKTSLQNMVESAKIVRKIIAQ